MSLLLTKFPIQGRVYVRSGTDIFLTGLVPRQISNTETFSHLLDAGPDQSWGAPMCQYVLICPRLFAGDIFNLPPALCAAKSR